MGLKSERIELGKGIYLNIINEGKFKSNLLSYYFIRPLTRQEVTKNTLLSLVLKRGSKNYPNSIDLERKLEELYGSNLSVGINKRGERHVIRFTMEWAKSNYVGEDYDNEIIRILNEIIFNPVLENDVFLEKYVSQEKENLKRKIENKINDKGTYAMERCIESMCKNERYGIYPIGYVEDLEDVDESNLFEHYEEILKTSPIEIFYVGDVDDKIIDYLKNNHNIQRGEMVDIPDDVLIESVQTKNIVVDELDVNQGKLVIGYRAGIHHKDRLYNPLLLASDILGGGPNSKLFKNVREKESLAYYISSSIYKYKSLMFVDSGIEFDDFDKTVDLIREQLDELKDGKFSEEDISKSIKSIKTNTESIKDSIFLISEFFFSQLISGDNRSLDKILEDFQNVKKEEIIEAANKITIDTIYFMRNKTNKLEVKK
ncbi:MAG: pitrilysin family protein [Tissierellaceae bacterium]|nr:pitrilysin family protein [Tissierellaceae bacterium]